MCTDFSPHVEMKQSVVISIKFRSVVQVMKAEALWDNSEIFTYSLPVLNEDTVTLTFILPEYIFLWTMKCVFWNLLDLHSEIT